MKKTTKIAVLVALGLAGLTGAKASTSDLLLGFNDAAGPNSAKNDYVIDLGLNGQTLIADALSSPGLTYDLSSTFNYTTFTNTFSSDSSYLNNVAAGVVGGSQVGSVKGLFQTDLTLNTPASAGVGAWNHSYGDAGGSDIGVNGSSSDTSGWSYNVAVDPNTPGLLSQTTAIDLADQTGNPLGYLSSGSLTLNLWEDTKTGSSLSGWTDVGTFDINAGSDSITFTAAPEPSTYVLGAVGMLALVLRRRISRLNA